MIRTVFKHTSSREERMVCMGKLDEVLEMMKVNELLGKKEEKKDSGNTVLWICLLYTSDAADE